MSCCSNKIGIYLSLPQTVILNLAHWVIVLGNPILDKSAGFIVKRCLLTSVWKDLRLSGLGLGLRLGAWLAFVSWTAVVAASLGLLVAVTLLALPASSHFPHIIYFTGTIWNKWKYGGGKA